jgi:hypothetical protein
MYSTKSFCNVFAFASNEPGVVTPIGELTTYAETFTKELGVYHHSSLDGYDLLNFSSATDGVKKAVSQTIVDQAVGLVDLVVRATLGTSGELYYDEMLLQVKTKAETLNANAVDMGPMVNAGAWWVPEWISWSDATAGAADNTNKVWLGLEAFKNQYTDYEIVVVPPLDNLDQFFNPGSIVESLISAITPTQMMDRAETAKNGFPATVTRTDPYQYLDPVNTARKLDVYWTVVIYGPAGNDPDIIRDALVNYIAAPSGRRSSRTSSSARSLSSRRSGTATPLSSACSTTASTARSPITPSASTGSRPMLMATPRTRSNRCRR